MTMETGVTIERPKGIVQEHRGQQGGHTPDLRVDLILDNRRVRGNFCHSAEPRRLVDILNSTATPYIALSDGVMEDLSQPDEGPCRFEMIHVHRDSILIAVPHEASGPPPASLDWVPKLAAVATIVLPGVEVVGTAHLTQGADPVREPLLHGSRFIPITVAVVTSRANGRRQHEPILLVNLARAQVYAAGAPQDQLGSSINTIWPPDPMFTRMNAVSIEHRKEELVACSR